MARGFSSRLLAAIRVVIPILLIVAQAGVLLLFARRWVGTSVLTVIPFWAYCIVGLVISLGCLLLLRSNLSIASFLVWLATLCSCPDEVAGIARFWLPAPEAGKPALIESIDDAEPVRPLRVVTLNCRKRDPRNLDIIRQWKPDIVLLQESPYHMHLKQLAAELYGEEGGSMVMPSWDCSIVARGKIVLRRTPHYFTQAKVELVSGRSVEVVSLHLHGAVTSLSLHHKKTWEMHTTSRQTRLAEMSNILQSIQRYAPYRPVIIGGDFNSPAGDRVYFSLRHEFTDSFRAAGKGWGNTVMNRYPVHRIDQIWASSDALRPVRSRAVETEHSDHRMVVSDFVWK